MFKPYIGVASVTSQHEAQELLRCAPDDALFQLAIGVGVTTKTLKGKPTNHPNRLVPFKEIGQIFVRNERALNLVHFSTDEPQYLLRDVIRIYNSVENVIDGIQINLDFPNVEQFQNIWMLVGNEFRTIWQVRVGTITPYEALERIKLFHPYITDILLDVSLGRGIVLDDRTIDVYQSFSKQVRKRFPKLGIGIAGGLSAENVTALAPLFKELGALNVDAESRLRDSDDKLDLAKAQSFVEVASSLYR